MFLGITAAIYLLLPNILLANVHGKILLCHTISLFVSYTLLSFVQFFGDETSISGPFCTFLGFAVYFSFLAAFSWLNMMCFDIYWTFRWMTWLIEFDFRWNSRLSWLSVVFIQRNSLKGRFNFNLIFFVSSMKKSAGSGGRSRDVRRFLFFSLYAWGFPCCLTCKW